MEIAARRDRTRLTAVGMLEDHEARITALEASQSDYRAVLAAVNALVPMRGITTTGSQASKAGSRALETQVVDFHQETRAQFRSVEEHFSEMRELIIDLRDGPRDR
jgi:hypothetical protein